MIEESAAQLLTLPGLITFPTALRGTTINLAFATEEISNRLLECRIASELDFSSDHQLISVWFEAQMLQTQNKLSRCWKNADLELARELVAGLDYFRIIRSEEKLEAYTCYLSSFLAKVMSALVLLQRVSNYTNP